MSLPAWIYARFSSLEQSKGTSLSRQLEAGRTFVQQMGWQHATEREITDEGKSAFHGVNRLEGSQLYTFEQRALAGDFRDGAVLAVEALDRLSRQGHEETSDLLRALTRNGVTVVTWMDNEIYPAGQRIGLNKQIGVVVKSEQGRLESDNKSSRLKAAWTTKIEKAAAGEKRAFSKIMPGWLEIDSDRMILPIARHVAVLNEIYDWYLEGKGLPWIENKLNARQEPTWGRGKHADANGWNVSTLHKYLHTRTVLGEYEPKARVGAHGKKAKGIVIPDYYPQVIAPDKFNAVQSLKGTRKLWGKANQKEFGNLFSGLATCLSCGGALHQTGISKPGVVRVHPNKNGTTRTSTQKVRRSYLRCKNHLRGVKCENKRGYRYEPLEANLLDTLAHWIRDNSEFPADSKVGRLKTSLADQQRRIALKQKEMDQLIENLMTVSSRALAQKVADLEAEIDADIVAMERTKADYVRESGAIRPEESLTEFISAMPAVNSDDLAVRYDARARVHAALHRVIKKMVGDPEGWVHVNVLDGLLVSFDAEGVPQIGEPLLNAIYTGPDGELDWHPDDPEDKVYQYAAE